MIIIGGNTYDHKDVIRAAGARWDGARKCWTAQDDNKEIAKLLVRLVGPAFRSDAQRDSTGNVMVYIPRPRKSSSTSYDRLERDLRSGKYGEWAAHDAD